MSYWKSFGLAIFAAICLLGVTASSVSAQCVVGCATEWSHGSAADLGSLPGSIDSIANSINNVGQVVGYSSNGFLTYATKWSHGSAINLGSLPDSAEGIASSINDAG